MIYTRLLQKFTAIFLVQILLMTLPAKFVCAATLEHSYLKQLTIADHEGFAEFSFILAEMQDLYAAHLQGTDPSFSSGNVSVMEDGLLFEVDGVENVIYVVTHRKDYPSSQGAFPLDEGIFVHEVPAGLMVGDGMAVTNTLHDVIRSKVRNVLPSDFQDRLLNDSGDTFNVVLFQQILDMLFQFPSEKAFIVGSFWDFVDESGYTDLAKVDDLDLFIFTDNESISQGTYFNLKNSMVLDEMFSGESFRLDYDNNGDPVLTFLKMDRTIKVDLSIHISAINPYAHLALNQLRGSMWFVTDYLDDNEYLLKIPYTYRKIIRRYREIERMLGFFMEDSDVETKELLEAISDLRYDSTSEDMRNLVMRVYRSNRIQAFRELASNILKNGIDLSSVLQDNKHLSAFLDGPQHLVISSVDVSIRDLMMHIAEQRISKEYAVGLRHNADMPDLASWGDGVEQVEGDSQWTDIEGGVEENSFAVAESLAQVSGDGNTDSGEHDRFDLNTATKDQLMVFFASVIRKLRSRQRIVDQIIKMRAERPFESVEDVANRVKGLGLPTMRTLAPRLTLSSRPPLMPIEFRLLTGDFVQNSAEYRVESLLSGGRLRAKRLSDFSNIPPPGATGADLMGRSSVKYTPKQHAGVLLDFLKKEQCSRLLSVLSIAAGRQVQTSEIINPIDLIFVKFGGFEHVTQAIVRLQGRQDPFFIALHTPRDSVTNHTMFADADNQAYLEKIAPHYIPKNYGIGTGTFRGVSMHVYGNEWKLGSLEAHISVRDNEHRFILWRKVDGVRQDILIQDEEVMRKIAVKIYTILSTLNEIDIKKIIINAGDFVVNLDDPEDPQVYIITTRAVHKGRPQIAYDSGASQVLFNSVNVTPFLAGLLALRSHDDIAHIAAAIQSDARHAREGVIGGLPNVRIASFDTVFEGFHRGFLERLQLDGAPVGLLKDLNGRIPYLIGLYVDHLFERIDISDDPEYLKQHEEEVREGLRIYSQRAVASEGFIDHLPADILLALQGDGMASEDILFNIKYDLIDPKDRMETNISVPKVRILGPGFWKDPSILLTLDLVAERSERGKLQFFVAGGDAVIEIPHVIRRRFDIQVVHERTLPELVNELYAYYDEPIPVIGSLGTFDTIAHLSKKVLQILVPFVSSDTPPAIWKHRLRNVANQILNPSA